MGRQAQELGDLRQLVAENGAAPRPSSSEA
jgi:hypothetical protein